MPYFPPSLHDKLILRQQQNSLRKLANHNDLVDFSSNDYLGFATSENIFHQTHQLLLDRNITVNGATGSRLISGNHNLYPETEQIIASFHQSESALIFNSGYDANLGFFSAVPQRNDIIFYDELCHASIRDGIRLSNAKSYRFQHNDLEDLELQLRKFSPNNGEIYIATESVFSMDGDSPNLENLVSLAEKHNALCVIDEAHALGVFGMQGKGLVQQLNLQNRIFARIVTFGKGLGCHGAAIVCSQQLSDFLVNFARSFIYTTALPPHSLACIKTAYGELDKTSNMEKLRDNISHFSQEKNRLGIKQLFVHGKSAIQSAIIPGNQKVKSIAEKLQKEGYDVKAILSPTVPEGQERLRFCLHSYNSTEEISKVLSLLTTFVFEV